MMEKSLLATRCLSAQERFDMTACYSALRHRPSGTLPDEAAAETIRLYLDRLNVLRNGRDDITLSHRGHEIALRVALDVSGTPEETELQERFAALLRTNRRQRLRGYCA